MKLENNSAILLKSTVLIFDIPIHIVNRNIFISLLPAFSSFFLIPDTLSNFNSKLSSDQFTATFYSTFSTLRNRRTSQHPRHLEAYLYSSLEPPLPTRVFIAVFKPAKLDDR
ncbi:hypothetical protein ACMFMG_004860 [Clarireedia jacksonii]